MEVKAVVAALPDHPSPKAFVSREQEEGGFISVRQTPAECSPVCPSSTVSVRQKKTRFSFPKLLIHPFLKLWFHSGCKAVPHELVQIKNTCLDSLLQTDTFTQEARILALIVLAVFALHIFWSVIELPSVHSASSRLVAGLRHHHPLHCSQRRVSHKIAWHKLLLSKTKRPESYY